MAPRRSITRLNKQQDAELLEVSKRVAAARARVAQQIRELGRKAAASTDARARERLYAQIAKINEALAADLDKWAGEMVERTSLNWRREAIEEIKQQTGRAPGLAARFDRSKVTEYLRIIHPDNASNLAAVFTTKMAQQDIQSLRQAFLETFRQGQFENWTANEIQKELQNRWNELAGKTEFERFVDRSGKGWTNSSYLQMLVRTTTARVAREGYVDTLLENGDDLAQIKSVGDSCPTCSAWDGVIVSLSGTNPKYPSYQQSLSAGMWHPACDCLLQRMDATIHKDHIEASRKAGPPDLSALDKQNLKPTDLKREVNAALVKWKTGATPDKPLPSDPVLNYKPKQYGTTEDARVASVELLKAGPVAYPLRSDGLPSQRYSHPKKKNISDMTGIADIKKLSPEAATVVTNTLAELQAECDRIGIPRLRGISLSRPSACATMGDGILGINIKHINATASKLIPASKAAKPWTLSSSLEGDQSIKATLWHEFGHHIHQQFGVTDASTYRSPPLEKRLRSAYLAASRGKASFSEYAAKNEMEWFAENHSLARMGKPELVDKSPELRSILSDLGVAKWNP